MQAKLINSTTVPRTCKAKATSDRMVVGFWRYIVKVDTVMKSEPLDAPTRVYEDAVEVEVEVEVDEVVEI